jgi:uncharacterized membrane protein (UPF0182 family)
LGFTRRRGPSLATVHRVLHRVDVAALEARVGRWLQQVRAAVRVTGGLCALVLGIVAAGNWPTLLRFVHGRPFGATDPLFGQDVAVYVFTLPFLRFLEGYLMAALLLAMLGTLAVYGVLLVDGLHLEPARLLGPGWWGVKRHLLLLLTCCLLLLAAHHLLDLRRAGALDPQRHLRRRLH